MGCEAAPRLEGARRRDKGCILQPRLHIEAHEDNLQRPSEDVLANRRNGKGAASAKRELATEPVQADRFSRARSARSASMLEDYTELIADLIAANGEARTTDIARRLGVAHPTASKTIARLKREGLATARPYRGIFLTEAGVAMAGKVRQRHRLVVDLLVAVGAPREAAEADAEGVEHYVSDATLRAFEAFLRGRGRN
jgi:DtxR family manganese transport transcriptional regulator